MKRSMVLAIVALLAASLPPGTGQAATVTAEMKNTGGTRFDPMPIVARPGDTITWTNAGTSAHTVTEVGGAFDSGLVQPGDTYSLTNYSGATIIYRCTIHSYFGGYHGNNGWVGMVGKIVTPPPAIQITSPANGATVKSPFKVEGTASDETRVKKIVLSWADAVTQGHGMVLQSPQLLQAGAKTVCDPCGASVNWSWTLNLRPGPYKLTAWAYDDNSSGAAAKIDIIVGV